jgi:hypothetical protein
MKDQSRMFGHNYIHQRLLKIILLWINNFKYFNILILIFITYVKLLPNKLHISYTLQKTYVLPEDGRELRQKYVAAIINKNTGQQVGINNV